MSGVLGLELKQRAANFEKRAAHLAEAERRKVEKDRILQQRAEQRRIRHEQAVAELRKRQAEEAEQAELARQAALEHNRGIAISATLQAAPLSLNVASGKGVRRAVDKVVLPAWLSGELMKQDAHAQVGQVFWRISARDGRSTCASALDFSAPEGVVMLPPKVVASLWGPDVPCHGEVRVEYHRLEKGTFVALTPESATFQAETADLDMEALLAGTLQLHTTLSEGDWIEVELPSGAQRLQVMKLEPAPSVSIIDTDLEAEVTPSQEFLDRIKAEQEAARAAAEEAAAVEREASRLRAEAQAKQQAQAQASAAAAAEVAQRRAQLAASLPPEPSESSTDGLLIAMFQMPDGSRHRRRFCLHEPVGRMFDFVESVGAGGLESDQYRLVTRFPRRVLEQSMSGTLGDIGLGAGQEVFILDSL